ncbi:MAG: hypothetical protein IPN34_01345 [Planctomycetes bacterium]|nr:hypothetical protein [Planctomycetota bacterium]
MSAPSLTPRDARAQATLEQGLAPAAQRYRAARGAAAVRAALARSAKRAAPFALVALPIGWLARELVGLPAFSVPLALLVAAAVYVAASARRACSAPPRALEVAMACDTQRAMRDRLSAALDLASHPGEGAPERARHEVLASLAIEDGLAALARLEARTLRFARHGPRVPWGRALFAWLALFLALHFAPSLSMGGGADEAVDARSAARASSPDSAAPAEKSPAEARSTPSTAAASLPPPAARAREREPRKEAREEREAPPSVAAAAAGSGASGAESETPRESPRGAPKPSPARASGSGRPGGGSGESSAGASESQPEEERPRETPPRPREPKPSPPKPQRSEEPASSSAGTPSGASRGSGRMAPVGNQRRDAQRSAERDDDPEVEEEELENENEEQQQRGGVMPMTRQDQRAPARELSISGDGPPDQGRGGPTPPKKSRGTASLVLGIRLPDQVRGQPNPGTAKTNLEETPPRRADASMGPAESARGSRSSTAQRSRPLDARAPRWLAAYHERLQALLTTSPTPTPKAPAENR